MHIRPVFSCLVTYIYITYVSTVYNITISNSHIIGTHSIYMQLYVRIWALLLRRVETKQIIVNVQSHVWIAVIVYICTMDVMKSMEQVCMYLVNKLSGMFGNYHYIHVAS